MSRTLFVRAALLLSTAGVLLGQSAKSIVATAGEIRAQAAEIDIKPDNGPAMTVKFTPDTVFQRVAPGEKDLRNAAAARIEQVSAGDRVLVTFKPDSAEARRIVIMPAAEIVKRNEADRQDWIRRGVAGVVAAKNGNQITLRIRSFQSESQATVTVNEKTRYKRYAPDSVKFADAKPSRLAEISVGDQLRARGQKSEDSSSVAAEEVVFGTFLTKAGTITAVNSGTQEITVKDLQTNKPLAVKLSADSQLKRMPAFGGPRPGGGEASERRGLLGPPADLAQMLERMPAAKLEDLKPGETIVVSSTKGASKDSITAIMLVANADPLIRMATPQSPRNQTRAMSNSGPGVAGTGDLSGALGGLEMPGMIP